MKEQGGKRRKSCFISTASSPEDAIKRDPRRKLKEHYEVGDEGILSPVTERPQSGLSDHLGILQRPCSSGTHKRGTSSARSGSSTPKRIKKRGI
ncbi:unnamed protein product [Acanthoscelides obtectus]|uniref:Uncharacterized protein n=1 Tax=Acanthoscelides obtectus TaxID=200917 RepID=A0A9P0NXY7_ACAOB|nr:unnamed protein product [Acanthoscelides obtectus]CAK1641336.1 hypothetical protein AOBTE_LOCUS12343 [Acanthoscelides obtectus]